MTLLCKCDICDRILPMTDAQKERWQEITINPMQKESVLDRPQTFHYCCRCMVFFSNATANMEEMYLKIKGTEYDIYAKKSN